MFIGAFLVRRYGRRLEPGRERILELVVGERVGLVAATERRRRDTSRRAAGERCVQRALPPLRRLGVERFVPRGEAEPLLRERVLGRAAPLLLDLAQPVRTTLA